MLLVKRLSLLFAFEPRDMLAGFLAARALVERRRLPLGDAERSPLRSRSLLGEVDDLADVIAGVRERTMQRLHHRYGLAANRHLLRQRLVRKLVKRHEQRLPTVLPLREKLAAAH